MYAKSACSRIAIHVPARPDRLNPARIRHVNGAAAAIVYQGVTESGSPGCYTIAWPYNIVIRKSPHPAARRRSRGNRIHTRNAQTISSMAALTVLAEKVSKVALPVHRAERNMTSAALSHG